MNQPSIHHHPLLRRNSMPADYRSVPVRRTTPWNDICDEILVPVGSLVAVFLAAATVIALVY